MLSIELLTMMGKEFDVSLNESVEGQPLGGSFKLPPEADPYSPEMKEIPVG